ncbi:MULTISPECIES: RNA polymerase sigma factor [Pseudomonas]|uniref:Sigma-70 family RNA polymerase sigma factor n=1 Tax=Pseudomonas quercus TaxID=2722792 RepID=A0ABX0YDS0_9PSED|nr:sigma-70 family RNA polymerase sigma factor [Pseudomonas sp. LY10J]MBF7141817.1 sigma-70 family RNA polymerase sigma factor [Pseudomonas sp. LY10J]NJP00356.1 sigma-70 family RNA polymerase sigma factor [Pseudomonas quercus]
MNPSRLDAVFLRHRLSLLRTLHSMVGDPHVAEDLLHDTWLRVSRALAGYHVEHLEPFVFQTARRLALDHLRTQRRHTCILDGDLPLQVVHNIPQEGSTAEDAAYTDQLLQRLSRRVARLTPRQRSIFIENRLHGQPCPAIARALGVSASTVQKELKQVMRICQQVTEGTGE